MLLKCGYNLWIFSNLEVKKTVNAIAKEVEFAGGKVLECKYLTSQIRNDVFRILAEGKNCIVDKINFGTALVKNITVKSKAAMNDILRVKKKYNECFEVAEGIVASTTATACLTKAGVKSGFTIKNRVPLITIDVAELNLLVTNLPDSFGNCVTKTLSALKKQTKDALDNIKQCVKNALMIY